MPAALFARLATVIVVNEDFSYTVVSDTGLYC